MTMKFEGDLRVGEASRSEIDHAKAIAGSPGWLTWAFWGGVALAVPVGMAAGALVGHLFGATDPSDTQAATATGVIAAVFGAMFLGRRLLRRRSEAQLAEQGLSGVIPMTWELTPDAFIVAMEGVETRAKWDAIHLIAPNGRYWIVQLRATQTWIPRRGFRDRPGSEQAFVSEVLQRLNEAARARSEEAERWLTRNTGEAESEDRVPAQGPPP